MSLHVNNICLDTSLAETELIDKTPVVFCAVIAVKAVIAYPPNEVTVLISA